MKTPSVEIFDMILETKALVDDGDPLDEHGYTLGNLIRFSVRNGWREMTEHLLSLGAPISTSSNCDTRTCLFIACEEGFHELVQFLLHRGAPLLGKELRLAALHGHVEVVNTLLKHGADTKESVAAAARRGHLGIVRLLLDHGADVNEGWPRPIASAIEVEHSRMYDFLIERGAIVEPTETGRENIEASLCPDCKARDDGFSHSQCYVGIYR
jgi:ankyrin repeat protein